MKIDRAFSMPSRFTFQMLPVARLIKQEMRGEWIDPFSGMNKLAKYTNDINPEMPAQCHQDALQWLSIAPPNSADGCFFDPPYSVRQVSECYKAAGMVVNMETTQASWFSKLKDEITRVVKPGGKVICCGWNSNGIGKSRGFEMTRILLVHHGGPHNDTIVTVERKVQSQILS